MQTSLRLAVLPDESSVLPRDRFVSADTAARSIRPGQNVFVGTGCAEPSRLMHALESLVPGPEDIELISVFPVGRFDPTPAARRHSNRFFIASGGHGTTGREIIDYVPIGLDKVADLLAARRLTVDVAIVQVSAPDSRGFASLGIGVDLAPAVLAVAKRVIAEVNPAMPHTHGDSLIHVSQVDMLVETDRPLGEFVHPPADETVTRIAAYVAAIVEDGSTLQIGMGAIPNHVLSLLGSRRDLGIHTDLLTDGVIDLLQAGAVNGRRKGIFPERIVASYCLGTRRLYDLVDDNPVFCFLPIEQVCAPEKLARTGKLVAITEARAIDLAGQVCVDHLTGTFAGGPATQATFLHTAAQSPGGKPIICLRATAHDGTSRIKPTLDDGDTVGIARADVHYVVTEFGSAHLFGRSVSERALAPPVEGPSPTDQVNLTDEESRIMPVAGGGFEQCYNAQAMVAAGSLLVVAADVVQAPNDKQQLQPMLSKIGALPDELGKAATLLADTGYFSEANVLACTAAGIDPLIAMGRQSHYPSLAERFAPPPSAPDNPTPVEAMAHRLKTPEGKELYALRKHTPEPVFGIFKSTRGFRQFLLRGLDNVRGEWNLVTMAWNMKRTFALAAAS